MQDDELKGTNRAQQRCRERSSDTEQPGRGCNRERRAAEEGSLGTSRGSCDLNAARRQATLLPSLLSVDLLANCVPVGVVVGRFGILGDQAIGAA